MSEHKPMDESASPDVSTFRRQMIHQRYAGIALRPGTVHCNWRAMNINVSSAAIKWCLHPRCAQRPLLMARGTAQAYSWTGCRDKTAAPPLMMMIIFVLERHSYWAIRRRLMIACYVRTFMPWNVVHYSSLHRSASRFKYMDTALIHMALPPLPAMLVFFLIAYVVRVYLADRKTPIAVEPVMRVILYFTGWTWNVPVPTV